MTINETALEAACRAIFPGVWDSDFTKLRLTEGRTTWRMLMARAIEAYEAAKVGPTCQTCGGLGEVPHKWLNASRPDVAPCPDCTGKKDIQP